MSMITQQHKSCLAKTICVIAWQDRRIKQDLLINPVFGNITINGFIGKYFIFFYILLWIQFYKLYLVLITLPLPELRKVAANHQKQLALIINPLVTL